jgi:hypothetical protein
MTRAVVVLLIVLSGSAAFAQAPGETPIATPVAMPAAPHKEPGNAVLLSLGTPVVGFLAFVAGAKDDNAPLALVGLAGMYFGPSTGQWYAGRIGGIGLAARAAGALALVHGISILDETAGSDCLGLDDDSCRRAEARWKHEEKIGEAYAWTGLGLWVGSTIFDIVMAHRATTAWNREHSLAVTPAVMPVTGGRAPGLTLSMTF